MQFSALAFPSDPIALALVPDSPAMQQEKTKPVQRRTVPAIEPIDSLNRRAQKLLVTGSALGGRVRPVRQKRKTDIAIRASEIMNFQPFDEFIDCRSAREQCRHDDDGAEFARNTIAQLEPGEHGRAEPICDRAVHQRDRRVYRNKEAQERQQQEKRSISACQTDCEQCQREKKPRNERDSHEIACNPNRGVRAGQPILHRSAKAKLLFKRSTSLSDQVITGIPPARIWFSRSGFPVSVSMFGNEDSVLGDIDFRVARTARKLLDSAAIPIARRKIHVGEVTARP